MTPFNRRDLMRWGAAGGIGALLRRMAVLCNSPELAFGAADPAVGVPKLLILFLRGANDGVNTVIPAGDPTYHAARQIAGVGDVWIDPTTAVPIPQSTFAKLHPNLAPLSGAMNAGHAAFLHAVGTTEPTRSHFVEMQKLETAVEAQATALATEGFVTRLVPFLNSASAVRGVSVAHHIQRMFQTTAADRVLVHLRSLSAYSLGTLVPYLRLKGLAPSVNDPLGDALWGCCSFMDPADPIDTLIRSTGVRMAESENEMRLVENWLYGLGNHSGSKYPTSDADVDTYHGGNPHLKSPQSLNFMRELEESMAVLRQSDCRVLGLDLGGFDTHQNQLPQQAALLTTLGVALASAYSDAVDPSTTSDILILVVTEFGRTNLVNGSNGTDHGVGALCMAIGPSIARPGVFNCSHQAGPTFGAAWVPLTNVNSAPYQDAVPTQTHFQTVLAEVCQRHMGLTPADTDVVIPSFSSHTGRPYRQLGFL